MKQQRPATPEDPVTAQTVPPPIRVALEHAEMNCDNAVRFLIQRRPDSRELCVQSEDIERTALALQAVCEVVRPVVERLEALGSFARLLRKRAAEDYELATTECSQTDSFMYVIGRSGTLKIIADALDAALGGAPHQETKVQP